jgi:hypothetical protein
VLGVGFSEAEHAIPMPKQLPWESIRYVSARPETDLLFMYAARLCRAAYINDNSEADTTDDSLRWVDEGRVTKSQ